MKAASALVTGDLVLAARVLGAAVLGAVVGWERESARKVAGLRTHMLVALSSALFVVIGDLAIEDYAGVDAQLRADPVRIIHAIAVGIGFLGAGVIYTSRGTQRVEGVTTAASIWGTAAVGATVGLGHYVLAVLVAVLMLLILRGLVPIERWHPRGPTTSAPEGTSPRSEDPGAD
jgi:putative Mg2+ transporter-C (MgtC) family protein